MHRLRNDFGSLAAVAAVLRKSAIAGSHSAAGCSAGSGRELRGHVGQAQACVITGHVSVSFLASPEARLAALEERRDAFLVVLAKTRQRELVDVRHRPRSLPAIFWNDSS